MSVLVTTSRLVVRPWDLAEAPRLFDIRSRESVARWLSDPAPWTDPAIATEHIERWATQDRDQSPVRSLASDGSDGYGRSRHAPRPLGGSP
jgi:RimJ/RimL family protein N-acetyltransferase